MHSFLVDGEIDHILDILDEDSLVEIVVLLEEFLHPITSLIREKSLIDIDFVLTLSHLVLDWPNSIILIFTYRHQAITVPSPPETTGLIWCVPSSGSSSTHCYTQRDTPQTWPSTWSWLASRTYTWAYLRRTPRSTASYTVRRQMTGSPPQIWHNSYRYYTW